MRRVLRWALVVLAGIAIAIAGLILEGGMLERIFAIGDVPVVDFATLQRAPTPNQYLLCPTDLCTTQTDGAAPVFDLPVERLQAAWEQMIAEQPRVELLRRDVANLQLDYVQRTRLLRFPDLVTVRFIPIDDAHATLAIYSRSKYGKGDMGVNHARIDDWLAKLKARIEGGSRPAG
ncbi:MAG TPA: DUF1499 domain-containing protein [Dongiaceae bacterium]|jgi:uncharacterized protein (DUF1499 family)|nr:DUF1499 domain-containing protein [Dongiaceae bacterium]